MRSPVVVTCGRGDRPGCGARIFFLKKEKKGGTFPVNADPDQNGNVMIGEDGETGQVLGHAARIAASDQGITLFMPHHITCSMKENFRKSPPKKAAQ